MEDHTLGYYQALIEARIPFKMVHDRLLDPAHTDPYRVLIFPNIAALSDAQCGQIRDYVQRGGSIVATYETSLYDEWGVRRSDYGLAELFGAPYDGGTAARMQNSYLRLGDKPVRAASATHCSPGSITPSASSMASPESTRGRLIPIRRSR